MSKGANEQVREYKLMKYVTGKRRQLVRCLGPRNYSSDASVYVWNIATNSLCGCLVANKHTHQGASFTVDDHHRYS